jgi:hypothetical protein
MRPFTPRGCGRSGRTRTSRKVRRDGAVKIIDMFAQITGPQYSLAELKSLNALLNFRLTGV